MARGTASRAATNVLLLIRFIAALAVLILVVADRVIDMQVDTQNARNRYLTDNIALVDARVAEIVICDHNASYCWSGCVSFRSYRQSTYYCSGS